MRSWDAQRIADAAGAKLIGDPRASDSNRDGAAGPSHAVIDSREITGGELFVGLRGERTDGGEHAAGALEAGAWGVLVAPEHAASAIAAAERLARIRARAREHPVFVLSHPDPLKSLQALAATWRGALQASGAKVVGITGSTGKTSTKDILVALAATHRSTVGSPENRNTEIGLPLAVLAAPHDTELLVLEMAMRGATQIAELTAIAQPDVGVIVNVGSVHLELLGTIEAIAAAKAELIAGLPNTSTVVVPAGEPLLEPHLRSELNTLTFGEGGDVTLAGAPREGRVTIDVRGQRLTLRPSFSQAHNLRNLLAAVAAALSAGISRSELDGEAFDVQFSALRGERLELGDGVVVVNDCYNANPMSMRAAIEDLAETAPGRRVAVLGDMLELGDPAVAMHEQLGREAAASGVDVLVAVGPLAAHAGETFADRAGRAGKSGKSGDAGDAAQARERESHTVPDARAAAELLGNLLQGGDTVLVKGSRGVGLEVVAERLMNGRRRD